jgi:hypothetical protein
LSQEPLVAVARIPMKAELSNLGEWSSMRRYEWAVVSFQPPLISVATLEL